MSRYTLEAIKSGFKVDVGYDPLMDGYFLQVRIPSSSQSEGSLLKWSGTGAIGPDCNGVVSIPEIILDEAAMYATVPTGLLEALLADRDPEPEEVILDPVIYVGTPEQEVWRYRASTDPTGGVQMRLSAAGVYSIGRRVTMALLRDFLGDKERPRRLVRGVAALVVAKLINKRFWIITERDLNEMVRDVEAGFGLRWLPESKCYAGEGARATAEVQLRRAARGKKKILPTSPLLVEQTANI